VSTRYAHLESPLGRLLAVDHGCGLAGLYMPVHAGGPAVGAGWVEDEPAFADLREQLSAYFEGGLRRFDLVLDLRGTPFQRRVWAALDDIAFGATETYGELAARLGAPGASRAVGAANGHNPVSIVVPCHRVVGAGGRLTGYGGGLERKRWLLDHERRVAASKGHTLDLFLEHR